MDASLRYNNQLLESTKIWEVNDDVPDQILGFDSWSLYATTNDAGASDVDSPDVKKKPWQVSCGGKKTAGIKVNTKAEGPEASIRFYS